MADNEFVARMLSLIPSQSAAVSAAGASTEDTEGGEDGETVSIDSIDANAARSVADIVSEHGFEEPRTGDEQRVSAAVAAALSAGTYQERFAEFVENLELRHFRASELLYLGGSNGPGGSCEGKNKLPSDAHWPLIVPTILLLDEIRTRLGSSIRITSGYRKQPYNTCVGGEDASYHMEFNALDFQGVSASVSDLFDVVSDVAAGHTHWKKRYATFVHLDTRRRL